MSTGYLLDSSILVLFLQKVQIIRQRVDQTERLYVCVIALGELYYGAEHSSKVQEGLNAVNALTNTMTVLPVDITTAKIYGTLKHMQRSKGQMLPDNDLWIAATAMRHKFTLAARDQHFTWIDGLTLEQW